jgi:hypothetical protein
VRYDEAKFEEAVLALRGVFEFEKDAYGSASTSESWTLCMRRASSPNSEASRIRVPYGRWVGVGEALAGLLRRSEGTGSQAGEVNGELGAAHQSRVRCADADSNAYPTA